PSQSSDAGGTLADLIAPAGTEFALADAAPADPLATAPTDPTASVLQPGLAVESTDPTDDPTLIVDPPSDLEVPVSAVIYADPAPPSAPTDPTTTAPADPLATAPTDPTAPAAATATTTSGLQAGLGVDSTDATDSPTGIVDPTTD